MDTTLRCIAMAIVQMYAIFYAPLIFCTVLSLFAGVIMYASAVLTDIKSIFTQIDRMVESEAKSTEAVVMQFCKEAIDLHARVYR